MTKEKTGQLLANSESSYDSPGNQIAQKTFVLSANTSSGVYETAWTLNRVDQVESVKSKIIKLDTTEN